MSGEQSKSDGSDNKVGRALARWADAEAAYATAIEPFTTGLKPLDGKADLVTIVHLRVEADRLREKYFKRCREQSG